MIRRPFIRLAAAAVVVAVALGAGSASAAPPVEAHATAVTHRNQIAATKLAAVPGPNGGAPPAFQINVGMIQGAVYDAVNAMGPKQRQPYLLERRFGATASTDAAVATAAYDVLVGIIATAPERAPFPGRGALLQTLAEGWAASLASIADGPSKRQGVAAGHAAADAMLEARADDGRFGPSQWVPDIGAGHWWPLLNSAGQQILDPTPWAGGVEPFLIEALRSCVPHHRLRWTAPNTRRSSMT